MQEINPFSRIASMQPHKSLDFTLSSSSFYICHFTNLHSLMNSVEVASLFFFKRMSEISQEQNSKDEEWDFLLKPEVCDKSLGKVFGKLSVNSTAEFVENDMKGFKCGFLQVKWVCKLNNASSLNWTFGFTMKHV